MIFEPRQFVALIDEWGLDDLGASGMTFKVQSLTKGKIYLECNPAYIEGNRPGVVIDDNGCWWREGNTSFKKRFIDREEIRDKTLTELLND